MLHAILAMVVLGLAHAMSARVRRAGPAAALGSLGASVFDPGHPPGGARDGRGLHADAPPRR